MKVKKIRLDAEYEIPLYGPGDLYEQMSVNHLRRRLLALAKGGTLFLVSNADHAPGDGLTRDELIELAKSEEKLIIDEGFTDTFILPATRQAPGAASPYIRNRLLAGLTRLLFLLLVRLEPVFAGPKRSHMRYILVGE